MARVPGRVRAACRTCTEAGLRVSTEYESQGRGPAGAPGQGSESAGATVRPWHDRVRVVTRRQRRIHWQSGGPGVSVTSHPGADSDARLVTRMWLEPCRGVGPDRPGLRLELDTETVTLDSPEQ